MRRRKNAAIRGFAILLAFIILLSGSCVYIYDQTKTTPQRSLSKMLDYLQQGKFSKAQSFISGRLPIDTENTRTKQLYTAIMATMQYAIADSDTVIDGDTANITVVITTADMASIVEAASSQLLEQSLAGSDKQKFYKLLASMADSDEAPTISSTVQVQLVYIDKMWKVDISSESLLPVALSGGINIP